VTDVVRKAAVWLFRHLISLALILLILIVGRYALPPAVKWLKAEAGAAQSLGAQRSTLAEARAQFSAWEAERRGQAEVAARGLAQAPAERLRARRAQIDPAIAVEQRSRLGTGQLALAAGTGQADRVFAHYRAGAEIALLERERRYIDALLAAGLEREQRGDLASRRALAVTQVQSSYERWRHANARAAELNRRPLAGARNLLCREARPAIGCEHYRALVAAEAERDSALAANRDARRTIAAIDRIARGLTTSRAAAEDVGAAFEAERQALALRSRELEQAAGENWVAWVRQPVVETLPTALAILATAIVGPALIKAFLYFFIAPLAARRPPLRLVDHDRGEVTQLSAAPGVSQRLELEPGTELLVVPEAVQSTPHAADKATQWLLSWSMPLSSLASGMVALIRIRTRASDFILVSATGNPLAEIALIGVAPGSALVLRPRALRGIVQPAGRPARVTRHWRLGHLSAWLTLQFRYLVFHGPCTLIVQGTRGVRLEPAARGRGINQAATLGFSAGLAYAVRRTEAFGTYLIGKLELFNDSFESETGWCLYEEMPREGERTGLWGRGFRGLGDAVLKLFGI